MLQDYDILQKRERKIFYCPVKMPKVISIEGLCQLTSIRHVAPSPSHAMDFASPCITYIK